MLKPRNQITKRVSIKTSPSTLVEVWENDKGEVLELHRKNGQLEEIKNMIGQSFEQCVLSHSTDQKAKVLVSRQALDEGRCAFIPSAAVAA
ncbi:hypothetical protein ACRCPS_18215 [Pseudomonas aeruginosa]